MDGDRVPARYASLDDLYSYLRDVSDGASVESFGVEQSEVGASQGSPGIAVEVIAMTEEDQVSGLELSGSGSSPGSSVCGSPSACLSEIESQSKGSEATRDKGQDGIVSYSRLCYIVSQYLIVYCIVLYRIVLYCILVYCSVVCCIIV